MRSSEGSKRKGNCFNLTRFRAVEGVAEVLRVKPARLRLFTSSSLLVSEGCVNRVATVEAFESCNGSAVTVGAPYCLGLRPGAPFRTLLRALPLDVRRTMSAVDGRSPNSGRYLLRASEVFVAAEETKQIFSCVYSRVIV